MPYKNPSDKLAAGRRFYARNKLRFKKKRDQNKGKKKKYDKSYWQLNKDKYNLMRKKRYYENHEEELRKGRIRSRRFYSDPINRRKKIDYKRNPEVKERLNGLEKIRRQKVKLEVLTHYSNGEPTCNCCHETALAFLTLDHINNDGHEERKLLNGTHMYAYVKRNGFPPRYQVLCWNCNIAKYTSGICPHKIASKRNK